MSTDQEKSTTARTKVKPPSNPSQQTCSERVHSLHEMCRLLHKSKTVTTRASESYQTVSELRGKLSDHIILIRSSHSLISLFKAKVIIWSRWLSSIALSDRALPARSPSSQTPLLCLRYPQSIVGYHPIHTSGTWANFDPVTRIVIKG